MTGANAVTGYEKNTEPPMVIPGVQRFRGDIYEENGVAVCCKQRLFPCCTFIITTIS